MSYFRYIVTPLIPVNRNIYKNSIAYNRPNKIKSIWEWLEKEWHQWIDDLACRWIDYRKFIKTEQYLSNIEVSYEKYEINTQDVVSSIFEYLTKHNCSTREPIKYILVGFDIYPVFRKELAIKFPMQYIDGYGQKQFAGALIVFVPNMNGLLFLSDLPKPINY